MSENASAVGPWRTQKADRHQVRLVPGCLDDLLSEDHRARAVWEFVARLDLSAFYEPIRAVEGEPGRPPIDPRILVALWIYAVVEGVGSARALDRLCDQHDAYRWICGGVGVNHHTLADFRVRHGEALNGLLTDTVALLMSEGLVDLARVAQDGVRVRASAGTSSFRSPRRLRQCLKEAAQQVQALRDELDSDAGGATRRETAARERAARERRERIDKAIRAQEELTKHRAKKAKENHKRRPRQGEGPRVSTTDADASVMRMANGGSQPAYNAQFATDTKNGVVVGVEVTTVGSDGGLMAPMAEQVTGRYGICPKEWLTDAGYATKRDIEAMESERGCRVYLPLPDRTLSDRDEDTGALLPGVRRWRRRMRSPRGKAIYRERAPCAEWVNATARNRGLHQFVVRGRAKVKSILLWMAVAHNAMRALALGVVRARGT